MHDMSASGFGRLGGRIQQRPLERRMRQAGLGVGQGRLPRSRNRRDALLEEGLQELRARPRLRDGSDRQQRRVPLRHRPPQVQVRGADTRRSSSLLLQRGPLSADGRDLRALRAEEGRVQARRRAEPHDVLVRGVARARRRERRGGRRRRPDGLEGSARQPRRHDGAEVAQGFSGARHDPDARTHRAAGNPWRQGCPFQVSQGDATSFHWDQPIDAVACEGYLGRPMSLVPPEIKLKTEKNECSTIILGFLKNLASQIKPNTPVTIAAPAWLRNDNSYSRLEILDEIENLGYNVNNKSREGLLYHRDGQIVARDIIILRKK